MISRFLAAVLFSSLASVLSAQSVVTATVQSASGGQPYASGNYQVSLVDASGNPLSVSGYQSQFIGTLSSAGSLSLPLFPNSQIQAGSHWQFHVCSAVPKTLNTPQPTPVASCFSLPVTIQGAGDISSTLAAAAPVFYACTQWSGSVWQGCGTGTGGSGTVNAGTTGQLAYYPANGTAVSGSPATFASSTFTFPNPVTIDNTLQIANNGPGDTNPTSSIEPSVYIGQDPSTLGTYAKNWYGDFQFTQLLSANTYTTTLSSPGGYALDLFISQFDDPIGTGQTEFDDVSGVMEYNPTANSTALVTAGNFTTNIEGTGNIGTCGEGGFGCGVDGVYSAVANNGSGTVTEVIGFDVGGILNTGSGSITNAYGLFVAGALQGVNSYGIFVEDQTGGSTNYAIKTGLGLVEFGDTVQLDGAIKPPSARKGTFTCTNGGTIAISNTNEQITSDVVISLHTAGGTITTPPAMKTVTASTGFSVLCGATDTSTYNYSILN